MNEIPRNRFGHTMIRAGFGSGMTAYLLVDTSGATPVGVRDAVMGIPDELVALTDWTLHVINFDTSPGALWTVTPDETLGLRSYNINGSGGTMLIPVFESVKQMAKGQRALTFVLSDGFAGDPPDWRPDKALFDVVWLLCDGIYFPETAPFGRTVRVEPGTKAPADLISAIKSHEVHIPRASADEKVAMEAWLTQEANLKRRPHPLFEAEDGVEDGWSGGWAFRRWDEGEPEGLYYWFGDSAKAVHFALRWQGETV